MKHYRIMGRYQDGPAEEIDTAKSQEEADYLQSEYRLAFGLGWSIWVETQEYQGDTLVDCG